MPSTRRSCQGTGPRVSLTYATDPAGHGPPVGSGLVDVGRALVLRVRQTDEDVVLEPEGRDDLIADEGPVVDLGDRLDQGRRRPVRGPAVIVDAAARRPLQRVLADSLS